MDLHAFAEELTQTIDEFDGQIAEFVCDQKLAVLKSEAFVLKLRRIISKAFSEEQNTKTKSSEKSSIANSGEKRDLEKEGEQVEDETNCSRKSQELKTPSVKNPKEMLPQSGRLISETRTEQIKKADQHLRSVEKETAGGFYTLQKCLLCNKEFNNNGNARLHVLRTHLKIGTRCETCSRPFFTDESLRLHMSKCSKAAAAQKMINVESTSGEKRFKVRVYSQSKSKRSKTCGISHESNKTNESLEPENPNVNVKVRNPFDGFSLKKATSAEIKLDRLNLDQSEKADEKYAISTELKKEEKDEEK